MPPATPSGDRSPSLPSCSQRVLILFYPRARTIESRIQWIDPVSHVPVPGSARDGPFSAHGPPRYPPTRSRSSTSVPDRAAVMIETSPGSPIARQQRPNWGPRKIPTWLMPSNEFCPSDPAHSDHRGRVAVVPVGVAACVAAQPSHISIAWIASNAIPIPNKSRDRRMDRRLHPKFIGHRPIPMTNELRIQDNSANLAGLLLII